MNALVIGNWKVALVECVAPQNNLLRDKAEFIAYRSEEEHHCDQAPQEGSWYHSVRLVDTMHWKWW